jgi:hypothetical protein
MMTMMTLYYLPVLDDDHMIDCDANDMLPFDHEVQNDDDDSDMDLFHDTTTWSEDEPDEPDDPVGTGKI